MAGHSHALIRLLAVISWIVCHVACVQNFTCPDVCLCSTTNSSQNEAGLTVVCNSKNIPQNIPVATTDLTIDGINVNEIPDFSFSHLQKLSSLTLGSGSVECLLENSLSGLVSLKNLRFESLDLYRIHPSVFAPLIAIKHVILNNNPRIGLKAISVSFFGFSNTSIESLALENINRRDFVLEGSFFKGLKGTPLKNVSLSDNQLSIINPGFSRYVPHLEVFEISNNFIVGRRESLIELIYLRELRFVDFSYQRSRQKYKRHASVDIFLTNFLASVFDFHETINSTSSSVDDPCKDEFIYPVPPKLQYVFLKHFSRGPKSLNKACISTKNSLRVLDASENELNVIHGPIIGLIHLEIVNLDKCQCEYIPLNLFQYLPVLKELRMGYNRLASVIQSDQDGAMFSKNPGLQILDISYNRIYNLSDPFLQSIRQLDEFHANGNPLGEFYDFSNFTNLKVLNLSESAITEINISRLQIFDRRADNHSMDIFLAKNPFTESRRCCEIQDFVLWTMKTRIRIKDLPTYTCISVRGDVTSISTLTRTSLHNMCAVPGARDYKLILIVTVLAIIFISIVIGTIGYRTRWRFRWLLLASRRFLRLQEDSADSHVYDYDAFVSFNVDDIKWVKDYLIVKLEEERGLKLCIHHRDFIPGVPIEENIVDAIERSRKTILLLTPNFVKSNWCHFEVHMARNKLIEKGYDIIVPIILEPFDVRQTSRTLRNILDRNTYLSWHESGTANEYFWRNLSDVLCQSSRNVILEE